ncbi:caspase-9 [Bombina bombina]|uniref:caspase-9 n=1 Tax=Bombina bombina TaxID=8345 RepID=UPI00235A99DC|nr:caspase-9 [Bombina bombina]
MEEQHRLLLRKNRRKLVEGLQLTELCDVLIQKGIFTNDMIEEIQIAGTRRDRARKLVTDLETRGSNAFPLFLLSLKETGQHWLVDLLLNDNGNQVVIPHLDPDPVPQPLSKPVSETGFSGAKRTVKFDKDKDYPMTSDPCGYCLIINNMEFLECSNLSYRTGSDIDRQKLEYRLRSFRYDVVVKNNLKGAEIHEELQQLAKKDHSQRDCCMVVILSHGCETRHVQFPGGVYGTDGVRIPVERIVNYFNGSNSPSLRGKPKLFFIQACGGDQKDRGFEVDAEGPPSSESSDSIQSDATPVRADKDTDDETDAVASLPTAGDVLVSYSTFPGYVSWRHKVTGSWYVEILDKILSEHAGSEDLQTLLVMVANEVSSKGTYKQIPGYFNFLRKRFYFKTN